VSQIVHIGRPGSRRSGNAVALTRLASSSSMGALTRRIPIVVSHRHSISPGNGHARPCLPQAPPTQGTRLSRLKEHACKLPKLQPKAPMARSGIHRKDEAAVDSTFPVGIWPVTSGCADHQCRQVLTDTS
jgi:hypothetical protein